VRALIFALDSNVLSGPVNVVAPEPVTMDALASAIAGALHRPAAIRVPALVLRVALGRGLAQALLTGQRALPRKLVDSGFVFDFPRIEGACIDLL
jgi:NAD dependent epimerase/dehydratase family enzyme